MPLEFTSISHGKIAFGFFNIETDMLLLDRYFFFAEDFCKNIEAIDSFWYIYEIREGKDIGNLMEAICGIRYTGFIGEVYKRFPFPKDPNKFKQNFNGYKTREIIEKIIENYGVKKSILFTFDKDKKEFKIGEYIFSKKVFYELIEYIILGGYPRWKDSIKPDYVENMEKKFNCEINNFLNGDK